MIFAALVGPCSARMDFEVFLQLRLHLLVREHGHDLGRQLIIGPGIAVNLEAMAGFLNPRGIVMAIPDIGHDDGGLAEIEAFGEGIVAAMVDDAIDLRDHRRLRIPLVDQHIGRNIRVLIKIVADIDQRPHRHFPMTLITRFSNSVSPEPSEP